MAALDQPTSTRKLVAILSADIVGYSALMGADEEGTVRKIREIQEAVLPIIENFGGRVIDLAGDGILAEFPSAVWAVESAVAVQASMGDLNTKSEPLMLFRIGLNVGDVIHKGDRLYGDGINVAARLQAIAEPGGICISNKVHDEVRDRVKLAFIDMGDQAFKNIARPVRAFCYQSQTGEAKPEVSINNASPLLSDRPSIAVLPFSNLSGDSEQDYFVDGVVEDILAELSRFKSVLVIARNSSFSYKGKTVQIKQVGRELGARYVLEGSVRKASTKFRINAQLIEAATNLSIWSDRFDGDLDDIFAVQDRITIRTVSSIASALERAELERTRDKPTERMDSYDFYLRARAFTHKLQYRQAYEQYEKAIALDEEYGAAYGRAADVLLNAQSIGGDFMLPQARLKAVQMAHRALDLASDDAVTLALAARVIAYLGCEYERAEALMERALELAPNSSVVWNYRGWVSIICGEAQRAIESFNYLIKLSPLDPMMPFIWYGIACASSSLGEGMRRDTHQRSRRWNSSRGSTRMEASSSMPYLLGATPKPLKLWRRF